MKTETTNETKTTDETTIQTQNSLLGKVQGEAALDAITPFLYDIKPDQVRRLVTSPQNLVSIGLCYSSLYAQDRERFVKAFSSDVYDVASLDNIAERAVGFWQADIRYRQVSGGQGPLGARILEITGSTDAGDVCDAKETRNLAAEYLRRGIEDIAAIAGFVFRNDPENLGRYPKLFAGKKKQGSKENGAETVDEASEQPTAAPVAAQASAQIQQPSA